jgi:hypothetical protein
VGVKPPPPPPRSQVRQRLNLPHRKSNAEDREVAIISVLAGGGGREIECCQFGIFTKNCWQQLYSYFRKNLRENRGENSHKLTTSTYVLRLIQKRQNLLPTCERKGSFLCILFMKWNYRKLSRKYSQMEFFAKYLWDSRKRELQVKKLADIAQEVELFARKQN